jgi:hypothetical protein
MNVSHVFRTVLIAAVLALGLFFSFKLFNHPAPSQGVSEPMVAGTKTPPQYALSILFIGNSYTYFNNMPHMLMKLAESDPDNHTQFTVQAVTQGGIGLKELWADGKAKQVIQSRHWNYVVLQEQSFWAMFPKSVTDTSAVASQFNGEIRKANANTLLFVTWPRKPNSHWYHDQSTAFLREPAYMQQKFNENTKALASRLSAQAIPVSDYWMKALKRDPHFELYMDDGTHPSPAGSYLAALVFYRYLSGRNLSQVYYVPSGVTKEQAEFLRSVVQW